MFERRGWQELLKDNLERCGFSCPSCSFQLRLSDRDLANKVIEHLKSDAEVVNLSCPECEKETAYTRSDLILFLPAGKLLPFKQVNVAPTVRGS